MTEDNLVQYFNDSVMGLVKLFEDAMAGSDEAGQRLREITEEIIQTSGRIIVKTSATARSKIKVGRGPECCPF